MTKSDKWKIRNQILWRLKGIVFFLDAEEGILTKEEQTNLQHILNIRDTIIQNSVENSRKLGFKAYYRDTHGKILKDDPRNKNI